MKGMLVVRGLDQDEQLSKCAMARAYLAGVKMPTRVVAGEDDIVYTEVLEVLPGPR
jgi:hypothetical protein